MANKKQVPVDESLFKMPTSAKDPGHLIGSKCSNCGEVFFPKRKVCAKCSQESLEAIPLSRRGRVYTSTVVRRAPPPPYKLSGNFIHFGLGHVELPEGVLVPTVFTGCDTSEPLPIGTEVEMIVDKLEEDEEGNDVMIYKFRPVRKEESS